MIYPLMWRSKMNFIPSSRGEFAEFLLNHPEIYFHLTFRRPVKKPAITVRTMSEYELDLYRQRYSNEEPYTTSSGRVIKRKLPTIISTTPHRPANVQKRPNVPFECDKCGMACDVKHRLIAHLKCHLSGQKHKCDICNKTFGNVQSIRKHCEVAHRDVNPYKEKRFKCEDCPKRYLTDFLLSQHRLSHENLKSQRCPYCSFATNAPYDLKNHIKRIHEATKDYPCVEEGCKKAFKRRCDMENHRKSVHSHIKIYVKCPKCEVIVLEKGLQSHIINRHSERALKKPYVCKICGKAERYEKNLQRHFEAVHEPTDRGVRYPCPECQQVFFRRRELNAHSFDHYLGQIYECQLCLNKYKTKKELTNHVSC